ncbi:Phospholipase [Halomonadaceae bacterium LMG 33818]
MSVSAPSSRLLLSLIVEVMLIAMTSPARAEGVQGHALAEPTPEQQSQALAQKTLQLDSEANANPLAISTYLPNYFLPFDYDKHLPNLQAYRAAGNYSPQHTEVKYQISLKVALGQNLFNNNGDLYLGYTQFSLWQAYNAKDSAPFRETNYEPELFLRFTNHKRYFGWVNTINRIGFLHQSNGRGGNVHDEKYTASRSWNRLYAEAILQRGPWAISLKPWWRIPDSHKSDNNPNIEKYLGYGQIGVLYTTQGDQEFSINAMGNPFTGRLGTEVDYTFPLWGRIRGMIQYYNGYGESLIDYNHRVNRVGLGFSFNPLLPGTADTSGTSPTLNRILAPGESNLNMHDTRHVPVYDASIGKTTHASTTTGLASVNKNDHAKDVSSDTTGSPLLNGMIAQRPDSDLSDRLSTPLPPAHSKTAQPPASRTTSGADAHTLKVSEQAHQTINQYYQAQAVPMTDLERERAAQTYFERQAENNPLSLSTYRRNYILPIAYNTDHLNQRNFHQVAPNSSPDHNEIKFQLSIKARLWHNLYHHNGNLYVAYTQRSWWQAYNSSASSPFRETNYEPELFVQFTNNKSFLGWTNTSNSFGFVHESNGRSDPISRSWNRLFLESVFARGPMEISVRPWWRIPESKSSDNNPSIEDYVGYARIMFAYTRDNNEFTWSIVGNPGKGHYGNQLEYSFPLWSKLHGYLQYYNGYGESMIDYNHHVQRFGIGISFNNINL